MNEEAKKKLLRRIPSGLYVIGVHAGDEVHGFTGSWFTQVSMKPPCVALGVRADSYSLDLMKRGKVITVNYFAKEDKEIIATFFKPASREQGRLAGIQYHTEKTGAPLLEKAVGYLECEIKQVVEGFGDHAVVIAEVINAQLKKDVAPLIMSDTAWHYGG